MLLITIYNEYFRLPEEFMVPVEDPSDLNEINGAIEDCIDAYLDIHHDMRAAVDATYDEIMDAFNYIVTVKEEPHNV